MLHSTELCCILSELRCTLSELRCAFRATLPPSELCCTLLNYAAPFRATLHTTEIRLTLNELRGTLKINGPRSTHRSFADPSDEINYKGTEKTPRNFQKQMHLFRPELGLPGAYIFPLYP